MLCHARAKSVDEARSAIIPVRFDRRVPMKEIYEMFADELEPEDVLQAGRSTRQTRAATPRHDLQRYYANLYVGLYHEMLGDFDEARKCLTFAARNCPLPSDTVMGQVARVHVEARGWDPGIEPSGEPGG